MKQYNKDKFSKFIFNQWKKEVKFYNFDIMYDIKNILDTNQKILLECNFETQKPIYVTKFWFLRETGTHICDFAENNSTIKLLKDNNKVMYKLTFCINSDYFSNQEYCTIEKIK